MIVIGHLVEALLLIFVGFLLVRQALAYIVRRRAIKSFSGNSAPSGEAGRAWALERLSCLHGLLERQLLTGPGSEIKDGFGSHHYFKIAGDRIKCKHRIYLWLLLTPVMFHVLLQKGAQESGLLLPALAALGLLIANLLIKDASLYQISRLHAFYCSHIKPHLSQERDLLANILTALQLQTQQRESLRDSFLASSRSQVETLQSDLSDQTQALLASLGDLADKQSLNRFLTQNKEDMNRFRELMDRLLDRLHETLVKTGEGLQKTAETLQLYVEQGGVADVALLHKTVHDLESSLSALAGDLTGNMEAMKAFSLASKTLTYLPEMVVELKRASQSLERNSVKSEKAALGFEKTTGAMEQIAARLGQSVDSHSEEIGKALENTASAIQEVGRIIPSIHAALLSLQHGVRP